MIMDNGNDCQCTEIDKHYGHESQPQRENSSGAKIIIQLTVAIQVNANNTFMDVHGFRLISEPVDTIVNIFLLNYRKADLGRYKQYPV